MALYDFLLDIGLTPAKSKTLGAMTLPDCYYADFLRGHFDGDGSIYGYWDKRWRSSLMYYTSFACASLPFLEWMRQMSTKLAGTSSGIIKPAARVYNLTYAKADSRLLFDYMYHFPETPYKLNRKYLKFIDFLAADPYASKDYARVL